MGRDGAEALKRLPVITLVGKPVDLTLMITGRAQDLQLQKKGSSERAVMQQNESLQSDARKMCKSKHEQDGSTIQKVIYTMLLLSLRES